MLTYVTLVFVGTLKNIFIHVNVINFVSRNNEELPLFYEPVIANTSLRFYMNQFIPLAGSVELPTVHGFPFQLDDHVLLVPKF